MRVAVIGGTQFIGRRVVEHLVERGDEVLVAHRGQTEPADLVPCAHLHVDRSDFATAAGEVSAFQPDAVVDTMALTRDDVTAVLPHLPDVPVCGKGMRSDDYDKLDVEPAYLARGGTVLRLAMIYGPHDPQRREELVLRRVRAGRTRIPIGPAATLLTRLHVDDTARAILAALDQPSVAAGQVFNIGEAQAYSVRAWMRLILDAAGHSAELVRVPEENLPADLGLTRTHA